MGFPGLLRGLRVVTGVACLVCFQGTSLTARAGWFSREESKDPARPSFLLAVGDPLALQNTCPCIEGYAQRDYRLVADLVRREIRRPVDIVFAQTLEGASQRAGRWPDVFIGKVSAAATRRPAQDYHVRLLAMLSDPSGQTTLQGLLVVRKDDPARGVPDLAGRRILFGPPEAGEKHAAAFDLLRAFGLPVPATPPEADPCTAAAQAVLKGEADAAVISDYAWPLLAACGAAESGSLRIVGRTDPVPFVGLFAASELTPADREGLRRALDELARSRRLRKRMETRDGFIMTPDSETPPGPAGWTDWRGSPARDAVSESLPATLPASGSVAWRRPMQAPSMGGLSATADKVIVPDKIADASADAWHCLRADTGETVWTVSYPAAAAMDYGSAPRAAPVIVDDKVYLLGALGDLLCVRLDTGVIIWQVNLIRRYGGDIPAWGFCGTPLISGDRVIVQTASRRAGLIALNRHTGRELWRSPGSLPSYGSLLLAHLGGRRQVVGHDSDSLGGWDPETGRRLWRLTPPGPRDFNVPTPVKVGDMLLAATENNGARLYAFDEDGVIRPEPWAASGRLTPDVSTPVLQGGLVWGADRDGIHVLRVASRLAPVWESSGGDYTRPTNLIAGPSGILAATQTGRLYRFGLPAGTAIQNATVFPADGEPPPEMWSHPALVGRRLYLRNAREVVCLVLDPAPDAPVPTTDKAR